MGILQLDLKLLMPSVNPLAKTVISFVAAAGISLLTYEVAVRKTRFGSWLGFAWSPTHDRGASIDSSGRIQPFPRPAGIGDKDPGTGQGRVPHRRAA
jgi:hypothetical protein